MCAESVKHADFALRMEQASEGNPDVPPLNYGRLQWVADRIEKVSGITVQKETVRKWYAGMTRPRHDAMLALAKILGVDEAWLSVGHTPEMTTKEKRARNAEADGAVNIVAGLIQMHGWTPAFPSENDARAKEAEIDLYAVIRGAHYGIHVALGISKDDGWHFTVPGGAVKDALVLGLLRTSTFAFRIVELDGEGIRTTGQRKGSAYEVIVPRDGTGRAWKEITDFSERL